jgi:glutaredoxin 3
MISPLARLMASSLRPITKGVQKAAKEFIESRMKSADVVIFSKSTCPRCIEAKALLRSLVDQKHIHVTELDREFPGGDPKKIAKTLKTTMAAVQDELWDSTGCRTVPRIFVNGECLGGYDDVDELHKKGCLRAKLKKEIQKM